MMSDVIPVLLLTVCAPLWIVFHYLTKIKTSKGLSPEDERMLSEIWESTRAMQDRIETLERILDAQSPSWRRHA